MRIILIRFFLLFFLLPGTLTINIFAQAEPEYDEIPVFLEVAKVGGFEISSVIKGEELYLPVTDLFDFLKIKNDPAPDLESITGFFINPEAPYAISRSENKIIYQDKTFTLEPGDLIRTESNLFLKASYFGKIFGLDCSFSFRSLSVKLTSKLELPLIREMRLEEMRQNIRKLKGEIMADTAIKRSYPAFRFGMADWSAISTQEIDGKADTRLNLNLGSMIAGGEATAALSYYSTERFNEKQQFYMWRYVDNDYRIFKQAMVGKIATQATSTIFNPVIGVQFTNTPTTYRRSFGSYTLSDKTEPGWIVELYVNNVLVDYVKADASGFFKFEVPLVYGNSIIQLKYFGPWGEERVREQNINIPFNFLPKNTFEYKISGGIVEDTSMSRFSRLSMNYGVTRRLTIGAGAEYLSSVKSGPLMPYVNASVSILKNLLLSGEYAYGIRARGTLSYRMPSNVQLDLNYTKYDKNQQAIIYNYLEERKASVSIPLKIKKFSSYNRLSAYQIVMPFSKYTTGEWMFSSSFLGINTNLTTYAIFIGKTDPYIYSNLSLSIRLPANFVLMPQAQYGVSKNEFLSAKLGVEKRIKLKAFLNLSLEENFINNLKLAEVGFRYNFDFAQTGASVRQYNHKTSFVEYARGSLLYDKKTKYLGADNQFNVGKGGISISPYIDVNANGIKDKGEPKAYGLNLRANGGRIEKSERDTTIRILGLEPYTNCFIEFDAYSFENITWRLPVKTLSVAVDPDIIKHIEIPVTVVGEATGTVTLDKKGLSEGLGRILVSFFTKSDKRIGSTLTEDDGYFSWFGLAPGSYSVQVDTAQLSNLGMLSEPAIRGFIIKPGLEGDIVDDLDFKIRLQMADTGRISIKPEVRKDTSYLIIHEVTRELITITKDSYAIQLGAFRNKASADRFRKNLEKILGRKMEIIFEDDFYKIRISEIETRKEADDIIDVFRKNNITELWVVSLKAKQQKMVVVDKQDSLMQVSDMKIFTSFDKDFYKLKPANSNLLEPVILDMMEVQAPLDNLKLTKVKHLRGPEKVLIPDEEALPEAKRTVITLDKVDYNSEIPAVYKPLIATGLTEMQIKIPKPTIVLQVGIFNKKSEALRAQRIITSKLKLPVEIVQQWEYFRVIITGFYTKEATYEYYPELAGLGYPGAVVIENK